jgi:hypothetical protein
MPQRSKILGHIVFVLSAILSFCHPQKTKLSYNFWMVSTRPLIVKISIPCDKTFPWVPKDFTLQPWSCCMTYLLKTLTLAISFEWYVLGLWYFSSVFLVMTFPWVPIHTCSSTKSCRTIALWFYISVFDLDATDPVMEKSLLVYGTDFKLYSIKSLLFHNSTN